MDRQDQDSKWNMIVTVCRGKMLQTLAGVVALQEEKKEEPKGLGKRDVGREGRKSRKMVALPTEVDEARRGSWLREGEGSFGLDMWS